MSEQHGFGVPSGDPDSPGFARPGEHPDAPVDLPAGTPGDRPRPWPDLPPREPARESPRESARESLRETPGPGSRRRRRRGRAPVVLLVVLLVVAGLLVAGDRLGLRYAEHRVAVSLQTKLDTPQTPVVEIAGTPFLTQLARRDFREVHVRIGQVPGSDTQVALRAVDLTLHDARPDATFGSLAVDRLDGTARLDYDALGGKLGHTVRYAGLDAAGRGRIGFDLTTTIFGDSIKATVTGRPAVGSTDGSVRLLDPAITVSGLAIPSGLAERLVSGILEPVELDQLPLGITLRSLDANADGLVAGLAGSRISVPLR